MVKKQSTALDGEIVSQDEQTDMDLHDDIGGRPRHEPTQQQRTNVEVLAGRGLKHLTIATIIGITAPTLRRHYATELKLGDAKVQALLGEAGLTLALGAPAQYYPPGHVNAGQLAKAEVLPDKALLIFLLKTRVGLSETVNVNDNRSIDPENNFEGMSNRELQQEIEAILRVAQSRKKLISPSQKPPSENNGSGQVH